MAANSFEQLIAQWEERLRRAFLDAIYLIRDQAQIEAITRLLDRGDIDGAFRAVGLDPAQLRVFDKALGQAFEAGGVATVTGIPPLRDANGLRVRFQFAIRNPEAERWLRDYAGNLIREIVDDQRQLIRGVLERGMRAGMNPRSVALDLVGRIDPVTGRRIGGLIGLTRSQEEWARNYAEELASDNPRAAMSRALHDKRFNRAIIKAAETKTPLSAELREKMVAAYRNRALRYRAETIARKEAITALHEAQEQALNQAVSAGVDPATITMTWRSAHDKRVRDAHRALDGESIRRGGVFRSMLGPIRYPGDPNASAANVINCRCWLEPKIDFLVGIR